MPFHSELFYSGHVYECTWVKKNALRGRLFLETARGLITDYDYWLLINWLREIAMDFFGYTYALIICLS